MENNDHENGAASFCEPYPCSVTGCGSSSYPMYNVTTCQDLNTQLIESILGNDITHMKRIMAMGAHLNTKSRWDHVSACHIAAMYNNEALALLISSGADSSGSDQHGRTPLHLAAWAGHAKQITLLLNFPEALRKSVTDHFLLLPEIVEEVKRHCLPVHKLVNVPCRFNESTLPEEWGDGMEHNCDSIHEMLPVFEQEWTALHAASARAQHVCVQLLLAAGADPNAQDHLYRTPLDVAGCAYYFGHEIDVHNFMETVDLLLKAGSTFQRCYNGFNNLNTPLHTAVELRSKVAAKHMLQGGASVTVWNRWGYTAMHLCARTQDAELLQVLVNHNSSNEDSDEAPIDVVDMRGDTVLCMAVQTEWLEGVRIALSAGATNLKHFVPGRHSGYDESTVFHLAARRGNIEVLQYLLNYNIREEVKEHINTPDHSAPPLYYAIKENHVECARLLINKGTELNIKYNKFLHLAVENNNITIAEMIIKIDKRTVHIAVNDEGRSPLYEACSHGHKEMIALLLRNGADLSGSENENKTKLTPIEILMNNLSKPTEFIKEIFDSGIKIYKIDQKNHGEVEVNFKVLKPECQRKKMKVIRALLNTGYTHDQQKLLLHPLVESFLYLQWKSYLPFFYIILALYVCFVLSLNVFTLSLFWCKDRKIERVPIVFRSNIWIYIIYVTAFLLAIQDIIVIKMKTMKYLLGLEASVKCLSTIFAIVLPHVVSWDSKSNPEWVRLFGSVTLLLTWVRMMYLLSRLPDWGYYVLMYGKVAIKVFKILVSFGFLIIGFSVSFMIQYHAQPPFEDPLSSLLTTMVMMTSELGYNETINKKSLEHASASVIMIRIIFVSFLILVSIILMNILVGVAVNDVSALEIIGNINRLKKQLTFIESLEETACNNFIVKILPNRLYKRWFEDKISANSIFLTKLSTKVDNYGLPTRLVKAIFENAQLQKKKSHEKQGKKLYQTKLDEIHEVIVNKDSGTQGKIDTPDNAKLLEEIIKLRTEMEVIRDRIGKNSYCSRCCNHNHSLGPVETQRRALQPFINKRPI